MWDFLFFNIFSREELRCEEDKTCKIRLANLSKTLLETQTKLDKALEKNKQQETFLSKFENVNESVNQYIDTMIKVPFQNRGIEMGKVKSRSGSNKKLILFKSRLMKHFGLQNLLGWNSPKWKLSINSLNWKDLSTLLINPICPWLLWKSFWSRKRKG